MFRDQGLGDLCCYQGTYLGAPVRSVFPFCFGMSLLKLNIRKRGTPITTRLLGNPVVSAALTWLGLCSRRHRSLYQ